METYNWQFEAQRIRDDDTDFGYSVGSRFLKALRDEANARAELSELSEQTYPDPYAIARRAERLLNVQVEGQFARGVIQLRHELSGKTRLVYAPTHSFLKVAIATKVRDLHRDLLDGATGSINQADKFARQTRLEAVGRFLRHILPYYYNLDLMEMLALVNQVRPEFAERE